MVTLERRQSNGYGKNTNNIIEMFICSSFYDSIEHLFVHYFKMKTIISHAIERNRTFILSVISPQTFAIRHYPLAVLLHIKHVQGIHDERAC